MGLRAAAEMAEAARAARDDEAVGAVRARASTLVRLAEALAPRVVTDSGRAWIATARAELARLDGGVEAEPWAAAIAAWDEAGDASESAYTRYRFAESGLRRVGVRADVGDVLTTAWRSAVELGAVPLIARLEELARRARLVLSSPTEPERPAPAASDSAPSGPGRASDAEGAAPVARRTSTPHSLSAREIEVLRLVAAGRSNGEIGDALFITRKTAGVHVTHILDKLGVSNRVEAAMAAARLGLLEQPDELVGEHDRR
jgi:DNA-binding CsgD family transcriptional regulator